MSVTIQQLNVTDFSVIAASIVTNRWILIKNEKNCSISMALKLLSMMGCFYNASNICGTLNRFNKNKTIQFENKATFDVDVLRTFFWCSFVKMKQVRYVSHRHCHNLSNKEIYNSSASNKKILVQFWKSGGAAPAAGRKIPFKTRVFANTVKCLFDEKELNNSAWSCFTERENSCEW